MRKLAPGFYVDRDNHVNISQAEVCEAAGVPCTAANAEVIVKAWKETVREKYGVETDVREVEG